MKLCVGLALRRCLLMTMVTTAVTVGTHGAYGGIMHPDVSMQTYTDFGQNKGRYVVGGKENALLKAIREKNGITVSYTDGQSDRVVISADQGMINFSGTHDGGHSTAIGPNFLATVRHNDSLNASFGERVVGSRYAINYEGIDIFDSVYENGKDCFRLTPNGYDYMLQRQSKIITDATWNPLYSGVSAGATKEEEQAAISKLAGQNLYRAGGGTMYMYHELGQSVNSLAGPYLYITGAIVKITGANVHDWSADNANSIITNPNIPGTGEYGTIGGATDENPLPWGARGGDSGSPTFVWNENTKQYEYIAAVQSSFASAAPSSSWSQSRGAVSWTHQALSQFDKQVDMPTEGSTVYLNAINTAGDTYTDAAGNTATVYSGNVTDAADNTIVSYNGIQTGNYTWKSLLGLKDTDNWYANSGYLNQNAATLFHNSNLVFKSASGSANEIILKDTVDLGVGYAEFSGGSYTIKSEGTEGNLFNHAGYVINEGAEVHLQLTNPADYMFEWRKIGEGSLHIDGTGDTNALLNVGGTGTTFLDQKDKDGITAYAAYNVLANTGATVQITGGINQIKRDFTFGAGGGKLDMYGHSMTWNNSNDASAEGFTIHALTEEAVITNTTGETTLTVTNAATSVDGSNTFLGSFQDSANGALKIVYNDSDATWTLHSIHTDLSNNAASGFEVASGKVVLSGTNTEHAMGSTTGYTTNRLVNENDWHYADAKMNVTVNGGAFELGSHARLTGDVTVNSGTYIMREGVKHDDEHVEGGARPEEVSQYSEFYGHKGNVSLASGANMQIAYNAGVTAANEYGGNITGAGNVTVALGDSGASLSLTGNNTFTGTKTLESGILMAEDMAALGDMRTKNKWVVNAGGTFVMNDNISFDDAIDDTKTGGVIALTTHQTEQLGTNSIIGAYKGYTVQYGTDGEKLKVADDGQWHLGGGGGTLEVLFELEGSNNLVLGDGHSEGDVKLMHANSNFTGAIKMTDGVYLSYVSDSTLEKCSSIQMGYRSRLGSDTFMDKVESYSKGIVYIDNKDGDISMAEDQKNLSLASGKDKTLSGTITVANDEAYRFGGGTGVLTIDTVLSGEHGLEIDAHGYANNKVILNKATELTLPVYVCGYNRAWTDVQEGDMTLVLKADHAFLNASKVNVIDNGVLDINGTEQEFRNFKLEDDGAIIDSSANFSGTLKLNVNNSVTPELSGTTTVGNLTINVDSGATYSMTFAGGITTNMLTKTGEGTLRVNGSQHDIQNLTVESGLVEVTSTDYADITNDLKLVKGSSQLAFNNITIGAKDISLTVSGLMLTKKVAGSSSADIFADSSNNELTFGRTMSGNYSLNVDKMELLDHANSTLTSGSKLQLTATEFVTSGGVLALQKNSSMAINANTITAADGTLSLESGSKLQLTATKFVGTGGKITMEEGAELDMTGTNIGGNGGIGNINNIFNSVQGDGTLKLKATDQGAAAVLSASADVHTNVETDALYLNSWKTNNLVVTLHDDSSLKVKDDMYVQSTAIMNVAGGNLTVGGVTKNDDGSVASVNSRIKLGHGNKGNTGTLQMADGSITTTSIVQANANDTANKLIMTGGTLEFIQDTESAIAAGIQVSLTGGTLKAEQSSWHVDRALELGDVTMDAAEGKQIQLKGAVTQAAGSTLNVAGAGDVLLSGATAVKDSGAASVKVSGSGKLWLADAVKTDGGSTPQGISISKHGDKDAAISNLTTFSRSGSTVSMSGASAENRAQISHALIDIMAGSTFSLSHAVVADSSYITDDSAFFSVNDVQLDVTVGTNAVAAPLVSSFSGVTLQQMGGSDTTFTTAADTTVLTITSSLMDTVSVSGSNLTINLNGLTKGSLDSYTYVSLTFTNDKKSAATFSSATNVTIAYGGSNLSSPVYFNTAESSTGITTLYVGVTQDFKDAVPEPSTTTLSLLALAALAARRRRK